MIVSYDIDGVLAQQPPPNEKKWGLMNGVERKARKIFLNNWYASANKLLNPKEETFYAISARKQEDQIRTITNNWLYQHYPQRVLGLYLLNKPRNIQNVVQFKAQTIIKLNAQRHYEDNKKVLKGLRKLLPEHIELYFWETGMLEPIPFTQ